MSKLPYPVSRPMTVAPATIKHGQIAGYRRSATFKGAAAAQQAYDELNTYSRQHLGRPCDLMLDDTGRSGMTTDRPGLKILIAAIRSGGVEAVILTDLDRLSRKVGEVYRLLQLFEDHDVKLHCTRWGLVSVNDAVSMSAMLVARAHAAGRNRNRSIRNSNV